MLAPVAWTGGQPGAFVVLRFNELPRFGGSLSYVERTFSASATTFHAGGWAITLDNYLSSPPAQVTTP